MITTRGTLSVSDGFETVLAEHRWQLGTVSEHGPAGFMARVVLPVHRRGSVIVSQYEEEDGVPWLHASISFADSMPTYDDLATLHRAVFGRRRYAFQVFAPAAKHVNIHAHALHLWGRADGKNPLPDFGREGTI